MKNHFFFPYFGNKRQMVELFYNNIDLSNYKTIIEPFAGSAAISYYISLQNPGKFEYIINDNNKYLIELYKIAKNKKKLKNLENKINNLLFDKDNNFISKQEYNKINKENNIEAYIISNKYFNIVPGLYPPGKQNKLNIEDIPIINFIRNEKIKFYNMDALDIFNKYHNDKEALIILDPPYLITNNSFYMNPQFKIYEYFYKNIDATYNAGLALLLEYNWIMDMLFKNFNKLSYDKIYQTSKKNTKETIFYNRIFKNNI